MSNLDKMLCIPELLFEKNSICSLILAAIIDVSYLETLSLPLCPIVMVDYNFKKYS